MLNLEKLQNVLKNTGKFKQINGKVIFTNDFMYLCDDKNDSFTFMFSEYNGAILISDIAMTYNKLLEKHLDIAKEPELVKYRNMVLNQTQIAFSDKNELVAVASNEEDCKCAITNLCQAITLLSNIGLLVK